ncbi:MAG: hypothetical protein COA50_12580 [Flavobacteriaceae bacterium]|nr:MAG: hypothetical protein COA50_12580 [Flavobacteriaceae bacterium]
MKLNFFKYSIFILFLFLGLTNAFSQNTVGVLQNSEASYNGYTFYTVNQNTYLIDNCGQVINKWTSDFNPGNAVYLLEDGSILRTGKIVNPDITIGGIGGRLEIKDWDDNLIWEYTYSTSQVSQHHDVYPLPNGNILILALTRKTDTQALDAGRNPANLIGGELYNEQIIEIQPLGTNDATIVWEWNIWDHLIQDFDNTKDNFGVIADNPQLLDINYLGFSGGGTNWMHVNSIQYNEQLDQIVFSARQLNEFYIIDHSTTTAEAASHTGGDRGKGGDLLYRWGNPLAYRQGTLDDQQLHGQHFPNWIPNTHPDGDKIILYNNGSGRTPFFSEVKIIDPPQTSPGNYIVPIASSFGPSQPDYTYVDPDNQEDFFSLILSSAQRLPNGNTLICEGTSGHFFEIDSSENIVWSYINPDTKAGILSQGDAPPTANNIFRVLRYGLDYPAFNGRDLTPGDPIELNPNLNGCSVFDDSITVLIDDANGTEGGTIDFPITLNKPIEEDITITFSFTDETAGASDYDNTSIMVTILEGNTTSIASVVLNDDVIDEPNETFIINVSAIDANTDVTISDTAIGSIIDDDETPTLTIEDTAILEGGILEFPITLSNPSSEDIILSLQITDITTDNLDYTNPNVQITIPAGSLTSSITIPTVVDDNDEANETFDVSLTLVSGTLGSSSNTAIGTILNDDFGESLVVLYPIPITSDKLLIVHSPIEMELIEVFNMAGVKVTTATNTNSIDLSHLSSGIYIVSLHSDSGVIKKKIVKQ